MGSAEGRLPRDLGTRRMAVVGSLSFPLTSDVLDGVPEKLETQVPMDAEDRALKKPCPF